MYAIVTSGGKQFKVSEGNIINVETLSAEPGDTIEFDQVLMVGGVESPTIGKPFVDGAKVTATVQDHGRGPKILVYKHKKNYKRRIGHRQNYTSLQIEKIEF